MPISLPGSVLMSPLQTQLPMYTCSSRPTGCQLPGGSCTVNHQPPCGVSIDRRVVASPSVVHCQFFVLFGSLLPNSHHCGTVPLHTSSCSNSRGGKSSFSKTDNPPPFKLRLRNSEEANGSSFPPIPQIVARVRRDPEEEKGGVRGGGDTA
ncbi:hypothetical protein TNCV_2499781 [Trichonephila clavipes]|nr:hypothetical protein TNCV_2499781 [Trichonephila clavipes]